MQTITLDPKAHRAPAHPVQPPSRSVTDLPLIAPQRSSHGPHAAKAGAEQMPHHSVTTELDAMLGSERELGAVRGLRVAFLFNAGLALSGLMAYEIWSMLAQ